MGEFAAQSTSATMGGETPNAVLAPEFFPRPARDRSARLRALMEISTATANEPFAPAPAAPHPITFMFLILPFGVMNGYLTVTVAWLLTQHGLKVEQVAALIAASFIPHTWKFLWAPIADTTLRRKIWYMLASVGSAVGIYATGAIKADPAHLGALTTVIIASNVAVTVLGMSTESLMAYTVSDEARGKAGGWFQAGNLGGSGVGGGLGLLLAQKLAAPWMAGGILALACLACSLGLLFVHEPAHSGPPRHLARDLWQVVTDIWTTARSKLGFLALLLCFSPIGSGAAAGLWAAVASDWHASAQTVGLVTGVIGGLVMAFGCMVGGYICDRMDHKVAYLWFGIMQAACAVGMGFAPHTEMNYIIFTMAYALVTGFTYAGFTAFVLEAMGLGAAATKFSLFASLSNFPIAWMTTIDGWAHTKYGPAGMLYTEAAVGMCGLVIFTSILLLTNKFWKSAPRAIA